MNTIEEFENDALDAHARTAVAETQAVAAQRPRPATDALQSVRRGNANNNAKRWGIGLAVLSTAAAAAVAVVLIADAGSPGSKKKVQTATTVSAPSTTVSAPTTTAPTVQSTEIPLPGRVPTGLQREPAVSIANGTLWHVDGSGVVHGFDLTSRTERLQFAGGVPAKEEVLVAALTDGVAIVSTGRVAHFDATGRLINEIGSVNTPLAVLANNKTLWVVDTTGAPETAPTHSLHTYDLERGVRTSTTSIPNSGPDASEGVPAFIAAMGGRPYVSLKGNLYRADGAVATGLATGDGSFGNIASNGSALVGWRTDSPVAAPHEVVRIDPDSGAVTVVARANPFAELAVDSSGRPWWVNFSGPAGPHIVRANADGTVEDFGATTVGYGNDRFGALVAEGDSATLVGLSSVQFVSR